MNNQQSSLTNLLESFLGSSDYFSQRNELRFYCPSCHHRKKKLCISLDKELWHCWVCDIAGRNISSLIYKFGSKNDLMSYFELKGESVNIPSDLILDQLFQDNENNIQQIVKLPIGFKPLSENKNSINPDYKSIIKYLIKRNINTDDIRRFNIGWTNEGYNFKRKIIIPSYDISGNVNYYVGRTSYDNLDKGESKYLNCSESTINIIPFELYVNWSKPIIIVEGIFDFIKHSDYNVLPLLGNNISVKLIKKLITHNTETHLMLDSDMCSKTIQLYSELESFGINVNAIFLSDTKFKDPGEMTADEFLKIKENCLNLNFEHIIENQLKGI